MTLTSDPPTSTSRALELAHVFYHSCCGTGGVIPRTSCIGKYFANFVTSSACDYISMSYVYSSPPAMMSFFMVSVTAQHLWSTWSRDSLVSFCSILAEAELESSLCSEFPDGIFHLPFGHLEAILVIRYTIRVPQNLF